MKKILLCLCLMASFIACTDDDETPIQIKESELTYPISGVFSFIPYYFNGNVALYIPLDSYFEDIEENTQDKSLRACDAYCPLEHKPGDQNYLVLKFNESFDCWDCNAKFDYYTGKGIDEKSKGTRINTYKIEYNKETKIYTVWM